MVSRASISRRELIVSSAAGAVFGCSPERVADYRPVAFGESKVFKLDISELKRSTGARQITERAVRFYTFTKWREGLDFDELRNAEPRIYNEYVDSLLDYNAAIIGKELYVVPNTDCGPRLENQGPIITVREDDIARVRSQMTIVANRQQVPMLVDVFDFLMRTPECRSSVALRGTYAGRWRSNAFAISGFAAVTVEVLSGGGTLYAEASITGSPLNYEHAFLEGTGHQTTDGSWEIVMQNDRLEVVGTIEGTELAGVYKFHYGPFNLFSDRGVWEMERSK